MAEVTQDKGTPVYCMWYFTRRLKNYFPRNVQYLFKTIMVTSPHNVQLLGVHLLLAFIPDASETKEMGVDHLCQIPCWINIPKAALILRGGSCPGRRIRFCSPGNARLKHSYQRSHFLAKKPTELISFISFDSPGMGKNREGVWGGGNGTASRVAADQLGSWERGCIALDFQSSLPITAGLNQIIKGPIQCRKFHASLTMFSCSVHNEGRPSLTTELSRMIW